MKEEIKRVNLTLRLTDDVYRKTKRACHKEEMKVTDFIRACLSAGLIDLIAKQEKYGCKIDEPI